MKALDALNPKFLSYEGDPTQEDTYRVMNRLGLVSWPHAGVPQFSNVGQKIMNKAERLVRESFQNAGFNEIRLPTIQDPEIYERTGRDEQFEHEFFKTNGDMIFAPTQEEAFLSKVEEQLHSDAHLPFEFFEITHKFRDTEPARGVMFNREFQMADAFSLHRTESSLEDSIEKYEEMVLELGDRLGIDLQKVEKPNRPYESYVVETDDGSVDIDDNRTGSDIAMYYVASDEMLDGFDFKVSQPLLCSYGIGIARLIHGVIEENRTDQRIDFPEELRPYDYSIIPISAIDADQIERANEVYTTLREAGIDVLLDDRKRQGIREKQDHHRFYGVDKWIMIGDDEISGGFITVELADDERQTTVEDLVQE